MFLEDMMTHWASSTIQGTDAVTAYFTLGDSSIWKPRWFQYQLKYWTYEGNKHLVYFYETAYRWILVYLNPVVWAQWLLQ